VRDRQARIGIKDRDRFIKCVGMLGSIQLGERSNAAMHVEKVRKSLDLAWDKLIVPACLDVADAASAADAKQLSGFGG
jgi:hypothetical protein